MCSIPHSHAIRDRGFFGCACPGRRCYSRIFARICAPAAHSHMANRPPPFANPATLPRVAPMAPSGGAQGSFGLRGLRVHALLVQQQLLVGCTNPNLCGFAMILGPKN